MSTTERIDQMSKEIHQTIDNNNAIIAQAIENCDKVIAENKLLRIHLGNFLETWEAIWNNKTMAYKGALVFSSGTVQDPRSEYSYEELEEYLQAAEFMKRLGRKPNNIEEVEKFQSEMLS